jgi:PAS domain S-box-containing protein
MAGQSPGYELVRFFDLALDALFIAGFDGSFKRVNGSFERLFGYSTDALTSRPFFDLVHPLDLDRSRQAFVDLANGADLIGFECRFVCADDATRRLEWNVRTTPDERLVYGIGRDVTERTALAEEQAALRRVATLVAREPLPDIVMPAVAEEVSGLVGVQSIAICRFEEDVAMTFVARAGEVATKVPVGTRMALDGDSVSARVLRTGRPARIDHYDEQASGEVGRTGTRVGVRSAAGAPIIIDGRLWGAMIAGSDEPLPPDTESRMHAFTELIATTIANVDARSELTASRARIVAAADDERRQIVRDLHDGAQQRLVHTLIKLKLAQQALGPDDGKAASLVRDAIEHADRATEELRELAHGILPATLTAGGLPAGVEALASRMPVPVRLEIDVERLPAAIEATAYFVVAEALTNVAKHSRAAAVAVAACVDDGTLRLEVRDDGVGGARSDGSGIRGLADRLAALNGRIDVSTLAGGGTLVTAAIPLASRSSSAGQQ